MKALGPLVLPELTPTEMLDVFGGEEQPGSNLAHDIGYAFGYIVGAVGRWFAEMPPASYTYCKNGSY